MKVLHLFKDYYPPTRGGVEQWINDVVHSIDGIEFTVLTSSSDRALHVGDDRGVKIVRAPALVRASTAPLVPSWPLWLRRLRPDVVHVSMPNPTGELAVLAARLDVPIVATYHADVVRSGPVPALYERFASRFLRRVQRVLVGSERLASTAAPLRDVQDRVAVVPYGVDMDEWEPRPPAADEIRERFGGSFVVCLGRFVHYKGIDVLVDAMSGVDAPLVVIGDGPLRPTIEAQIAQLGVGDRVHLVGEIQDDERAAYLHAADVFVLPGTNRGESYGIAMVQAMACGTPAISTELGTGTSWVNVHGSTGLVVPPRDSHALAEAIEALLRDPAKRAAMGEAAQGRVRERLTRGRMLADLRSVYEQAAQAR